MKKSLLTLLILISLSSYGQYNYLGTYTSNGTPNYLEAVGDVISVATQELISNALPESFPVPDYNPHYISSGYDTDLALSETADVYVTFVAEGAGYRNVLGFYTYDVNNPPTTTPAISDITIIFPNVSALGSGGGLQMGDKVNIGTFPAGTGIGWVLIANGWQGGAVGSGYWKLYSNTDFNPEYDSTLRHHNVLLAEPENERILLGFEDIRRDYGSCDNDFNDAIFYVTASPYSAITATNYADITDATEDVTSASGSGLESNGKLASLIAKRNFNRKKSGVILNRKNVQNQYNKSNQLNLKSSSAALQSYLPDTGMYGDETAHVSSPTDLLEITNAEEVFSLDMYKGDKRVSAVLATKTKGKVYDHSKAICDRLNNSSLEDVRSVTVRGHKIISSKIKRLSSKKEYTLSFSVKLGDTSNELFSIWNIDEYPEGDYYNFQIWGSSFSQVFTIANHILDKFTAEKTFTSVAIEDNVPTVFVKSGYYEKGQVHLNLINKNKSNLVTFNANISETEIASSIPMTKTIALNGQWNESITISTGALFDIGFSLSTDASTQKDALYLADGPWGVDSLEEYATINSFNVLKENLTTNEEIYQIERQPSISGEVKGTVNLFRHLLPGDQTLQVSEYSAIQFEIKNNVPIEVILVSKNLVDWNNRLRTTVVVNDLKTVYNIAFEDFVDGDGNSLKLNYIKTIVFSIKGDYVNFKNFNLELKNVSFGTPEVLTVDDIVLEKTKVVNYPNPFINATTIKLINGTQFIDIQVVDMLGRVVDRQKINTNGNNKKVIYNSPIQLKTGVYRYLFYDDTKQKYKGSFIIY
jgi:hypothetical protein